MIEFQPRTLPETAGKPEGVGPDHPIRGTTQKIAFEPGAWTRERAGRVATLFDELAPEWHLRISEERTEPLRDAIERGGPLRGRCVELGSGTGAGTGLLAQHFAPVVAIDLSREMLLRAPSGPGHRTCADASRLPLADGSVDVLVLLNMFLFPAEVERVLAPEGALVFVSALGDRTPIYLAPEEIERALPGPWSGSSAEAGWGCWTVLRRGSAA